MTRKLMPEFFGDKGHEGVKEMERGVKDSGEVDPCRRDLGRRRNRRDGRLHPFQVPITDLVPEEVVNRMGRFVETVASESFVDLLRDGQQARKNPAVGQPEVFRAGHRLKAHAGNRL